MKNEKEEDGMKEGGGEGETRGGGRQAGEGAKGEAKDAK